MGISDLLIKIDNIGEEYYKKPEWVLKVVTESFKLTLVELKGRNKKRPKPEARQHCCYILTSLGYTLEYIAKLLGDRDHSTVIYSRDVIRGFLEIDTKYKKQFFLRYQNKIPAILDFYEFKGYSPTEDADLIKIRKINIQKEQNKKRLAQILQLEAS